MTVDVEKARALVEKLHRWAEDYVTTFHEQALVDDGADTIAALLDEVERLNSPVVLSEWQKLVAERDALARDAARYRWLRAHPLDGSEEDTPCIRASGRDTTHWALNGDAADAAIDAAMGASDE